jgi:hypothetical protein
MRNTFSQRRWRTQPAKQTAATAGAGIPPPGSKHGGSSDLTAFDFRAAARLVPGERDEPLATLRGVRGAGSVVR